MTKIEKTLKELSDLYRFYHKIKKVKAGISGRGVRKRLEQIITIR